MSVPVIVVQSVSHLPTTTKGILNTEVIANYESVTGVFILPLEDFYGLYCCERIFSHYRYPCS